MTKSIGKLANNTDINKGSVLLLFDDDDAEIVRNWQRPAKSDEDADKADSPSP